MKCPCVKEECPLLDRDGNRRYWCDTNLDPTDFEICPIPNKRLKAIKKATNDK